MDASSDEEHALGVFLQNGKYLCALCGAEIEITPDQRPLALIKASSGEPNVRVIMLGDKVLHECPIDPSARTA